MKPSDHCIGIVSSCALPDFMLCALGTSASLLLSTMDSQLEAVRHKMCKVEDEIVELKQDLAAAKEAKNGEQERKLFDMLLSLNNQLSGLQEKENILMRSLAPSKPAFS